MHGTALLSLVQVVVLLLAASSVLATPASGVSNPHRKAHHKKATATDRNAAHRPQRRSSSDNPAYLTSKTERKSHM